MVTKNKITLLSLREIKKSYKRFISLLIMSFLGVAVFVGMRNASGSMLATIDKYYDNQNVYDVKVVSTLGLTEEDIRDLKELDLVDEAYGAHSSDVYYYNKDDTYVLKIFGINDSINKTKLLEGKYPTNNNEIIVEEHLLKTNNIKIGDYIEIDDPDELIKSKKMKIVGTVKSPLYLLVNGPSLTRDTTNIGSGTVNFYAYTNDESFDIDYYTEIYITIKGAKELITSKEEYDKLIDYGLGEIKAIKKYREKARYDEIYNKVMDEILDNERKGQEELNKANIELLTYKNQLDNGLKELNYNKQRIENGKNDLVNGEIELSNAKKQLDDGYYQLNSAKEQLENSRNEINNRLAEYGLTIDDIYNIYLILNGNEVPREEVKKLVKDDNPYKESIYQAIDYIYDNNCNQKINNLLNDNLEKSKQEIISVIPPDIENYDEVIKFINDITLDDIRNMIYTKILDTSCIDNLKQYIPKDIYNYDKIISFLDDYSNRINEIKQLFQAVISIKNAEQELATKEQELNNAYNLYNLNYQKFLDSKNQLLEGEKELNKGFNEYYNNKMLYDSKVIEFNSQKIDFEKKIAQAKEDINSLEKPNWYISIRDDIVDYSSYIGVGGSIDKLSGVFPTIFYIVAIFMSILSMSRMALEDRQEIGSLKSLGYSNIHCMTKYIIYSSLATIMGGILGAIFGFYYLIYFIWDMYNILFVTDQLVYYYDFIPMIIGIIVALICISGTTILTINTIIKENTASLLRPKAPTEKNSLFLEKMPLWNKINFSNKITIRNIFRYKKRVILTVIGIAGCTILLLIGYGVRDSLVNITTKQFNDVTIYDDIIYHNGNYNSNNDYLNDDNITKLNGNLLVSKVGIYSTNVISFNNYNKVDKMFNLKSIKNNKKIELKDNSVVISSKLAELENIKIGDTITIKENNNSYKVVITDIFDNYINHYILMNKKTYEKNITNYNENILYLKFKDKTIEDEVISKITEDDNVLAVENTSFTVNTVDSMLKSLDNIVYILIVFSATLSFVVLYNLSYINISERKREIATLKVLGFYDNEVDNYIIKENFIITVLGIIMGILFGKYFVYYIVDAIEIDLFRFIHRVDLLSYIKTFSFMIGFTLIVSIIIHFTLKRINMIDSLKSVD